MLTDPAPEYVVYHLLGSKNTTTATTWKMMTMMIMVMMTR